MLWQLFISFFKIGTFTIGGGFAMIPLMQREVVERRKWLSDDEFEEQMAVSQALPGVFAVNMATSIGYRSCGVWGATCAVLGAVTMPIGIILLLAMFFNHFSDNPTIEHIFMGIRPAVVALIAAPVFNMTREAHFNWRTIWIPIIGALLIWLLGVSPIMVILLAIGAGFLWHWIVAKKTNA